MAPDSHRAITAAEQALADHVQDSTQAWKDMPIDDHASNPPEVPSESSPQSPLSKPSLSEAINRATHSLHTDLNSAIVQAIPHGLPPEAETPDLYAHGLAVFVGTVYQTFEAEWAHLRHETIALSPLDLSGEMSNDDTDLDEESAHDQKNHKKKLHRYLAHLLPVGIERTSRIRQDLEYLGVDPQRKPTPNSVEARYEAHIRTSTRAKPHLLLAYSWCMYMAIFAGGRYVRQSLSDVPESFWEAGHSAGHPQHPVTNPFFEDNDDDEEQDDPQEGGPGASSDTFSQLDRPGYSFLSFDGSDDGVSIAQAFRAGFAKADHILTEQERREVIAESQTVFEYCIALVKELKSETAAVVETTYEEAERVVDREKRALMQALEMGDEEGQTRRPRPVRKSRIFLLKAVTFGLLWMLFFGRIVTWLTDKTPQREQA